MGLLADSFNWESNYSVCIDARFSDDVLLSVP